ncbi:hypothetical protein [Corynebacterium sp. LK2522]|uniref:hypothetical protein n=1 Tax=Corynebacterium sp. LK2522 TaxID=3110474 RepID=UPI0034D0027F
MRNHRRTRKFSTVLAAVAVTLGGTQAAQAQVLPQPADLSSQAGAQVEQLSSQLPQVELPAPAYEAADRFGIQLPAFIAPPQGAAFAQVRSDLGAATHAHLVKQGHHPNQRAAGIAQQWADEAAAGKVHFNGKVGHGTAAADADEGSVHRLTEQEARERTAWLNRDVPVTRIDDGRGFGVATATDGKFVYVAEFFLR